MIYDTGLNPVIPSYHADFAYGCHNEPIVIHHLSKYFNEPIEKTKDRYCLYDAFSNTTKYEIKSRRCKSTTFATTIIPIHKVIANDDVRLVFVFHFTDGLFYIVYDKDVFDKFEKKHITAYRQGIANIPVLHYFIPVSQLIEIVV
jgi:hypothetical protein